LLGLLKNFCVMKPKIVTLRSSLYDVDSIAR